MAGTTYWVVLQGDYTESATANIEWKGKASADVYAAGQAKAYNATDWTQTLNANDMSFSIYVTENDAAVTMPSGYDQRCLIGYVYNDSSSNFVPMAAVNKSVVMKNADIATYSSQDPVITSLSTVVPPVPVYFKPVCYSTSSGGIMEWEPIFDHQQDFWRLLLPLNSTDWTMGTEVYTQYQGIYGHRGNGTGAVHFGVHGFVW